MKLRLEELRRAKGVSQVHLAKEFNVSKQSVSNWENENILPSIEKLVTIAEYFSVSVDYLLGLDDQRYLDISGLTDKQISHIQLVIDDIVKANKAKK